MARFHYVSVTTLPRLKELGESLGMEQARVARIALALGLRYHTHEVATAHTFQRAHETNMQDFSLDPEQNQLRLLKLIVESRTGHRLDQDAANAVLDQYLDLGFGKLYDAWEANDRNRYQLFAALKNVIALSGTPTSWRESTNSSPVVVLGADAHVSVAFRPNIEGGYRNAAHLAIVGSSGVGKTQCALALLDQTLAQSPSTGCVLLDYKGDISRKETAFLKRHGFETYVAGKQALPINPLFLPADANPDLAAQDFAQRLTSVEGLGAVQEGLIREAVRAVYADRELFQPTLALLKEQLLGKYEQAKRGNKPDKALTLIESIADFNLFQGETGLDPATFLSKRVIIDFGQSEAFRDLLAFFVLNYITNGMKLLGDAPVTENPDGTRTRDLRSILFIDEAHNYLRADANPVYNIVREARSFGIGLWLSTQALADFKSDNDDLTTNLSTWLLFSTGTVPNATKVAGLLRITKPEAETIVSKVPTLGNGECYVNVDGHPKRIMAVQLWNRDKWPEAPADI